MKSGLIILLTLLLSVACVKEEGKVAEENISSDGGGASGGGSSGTTPSVGSDPLAFYAWHLENTGQNSFSSSGGVPGQDISLKYVHETLDILGRGVTIAVSDTGTDTGHPDLSGNTLSTLHRNYSLTSSSQWHGANPYPSDDEAHGTGVAGLISALGWNDIGSRGVAPESQFAAFRYLYDSGDETAASLLAKTIDQTNGDFDIFNYSYGYSGYVYVLDDPTVYEAYEVGATSLRDGKGVLYVQSAGNSFDEYYELCDADVDPDCAFYVSGNTNAHSDLATPYKIVVGAVNADGERSSYSTPGSSVWISAPGGEFGTTTPAMVTTDIQGCSAGSSYRNSNYPTLFDFGGHSLNLLCDYTNRFNGTSSAAPVTSGVIALMLEANPNLTWRDVKHILAITADKIDYDIFDNILSHPHGLNPFGVSYDYDYKWILNQAGHLFSNWYGFGRVNATDAVQTALTYNLSTLGTFEQTKNSSGTWYYDSGTLSGKTIIDESTSYLEDRIWVGHSLTVEAVQIKLTTDHPWPGDLAIHLVSPSGTEGRLLTLNNNIYGDGLESEFIMLSNAFYGEDSEGYWTIRIYDGDALFGSGQLDNWKILVSGHREASDLGNPYPPTSITLGAVPASLDRTPLFSFADSESAASVLYYQAAIGDDFDNENILNWTSIGLSNASQQITGLSLNSGTTYYLKLRAVSSSGVSAVQLIQWTTP
ncbi:MAG: S8 family serine peptidase [Bacteriovoracia bacterium]